MIFIDFLGKTRQYNGFCRFPSILNDSATIFIDFGRGDQIVHIFGQKHRADKSLKIMPPEPQVRYGRTEFSKVVLSLDVFSTFLGQLRTECKF